MLIFDSIQSIRDTVADWKKQNLKVAFVPTMGNLHAGHFHLVERAKCIADRVVVSIFVNPMQFGANEDLDKYPRTLEQDIAGLEERQADLLFTPTPTIIYPKGLEQQSFVDVPGVSEGHCGGDRPGHFRGVATVVAKLFNIVQPDIACFGEKDFQQLQVIRTMVEDLSLPIEIIGVPTQRASSGLALSSRNGYLSEQQLQTATALYQALQYSKKDIEQGQRNYSALAEQAKRQLLDAGLAPEYFNICDRKTLKPAGKEHQELVILAAAKLGSVRLIDNIQITL